MEKEKLFCKGGGCTAKLGAGILSRILSKIPQKIKQQKSCQNPNIESGFSTGLFYIFFPCQLYF